MKPLLLLIAILSPFADDKQKPVDSDFKQIQGTWENASRRFRGKDLEPFEDRMVVTEDFMKSQPESPGTTYVYELDPTSKPKRITQWAVLESGAQSEAHHGVYKLEGDTLTICTYVFDDGRRPTKFSAEKDDGNVLEVYRRVKPK